MLSKDGHVSPCHLPQSAEAQSKSTKPKTCLTELDENASSSFDSTQRVIINPLPLLPMVMGVSLHGRRHQIRDIRADFPSPKDEPCAGAIFGLSAKRFRKSIPWAFIVENAHRKLPLSPVPRARQ
ncbi:predicted protein [Histoplasma capsulatum G186AR]|uniref:Uncharacterized protein n=1 Tax=Ajellomyces capsulatus (strain G186AR / H82 / ATCC MYA-2454 / RMSCC 2432) TaxID=447093 RepID=C0NHT2_AJECG|nr:uncharacterized protein HCBG_02904 [Histoplasma capsulatum G186AR]EEH09367.1 predicted protein [Histoplasma capsulatum G186AR]